MNGLESSPQTKSITWLFSTWICALRMPFRYPVKGKL